MSKLILPQSLQSDLGLPNIRTSTSHKVYRWRHLAMWAEGGRIKIDNTQTGEYSSCSRLDFIERAEAFERAVEKMRYSSDKRDHRQLLGLMAQVIQDAQGQGDPHDPRQLRDMLSRGRNRKVFGRPGTHYPTDRTPCYPDGTPLFTGEAGTTLLPTLFDLS